MEMSYYGLVRLLTLGLILLSLCLRLGHRKLNLPPGPWPIIGNLNLMGPLPHRSIHALSQKYGPIMQLRFGSFLVVVGSSPEIAKAFLKTTTSILPSVPKPRPGYTPPTTTPI
ncbi:hypothetical protein SLE2022_308170 [Rubroshorea leprosula]